ncbi:hypothetical protein [Actinomadura latina]|uniref:Nucleoside 2-deoxyribosyltransferase n=1 Tax=Actinomadura latina TaxID=163603 RepID=A0A846YXC8_9ACTN|nr:hypothetical protein [Actinomadura latina]NKZ04347.1 hypothetical protein [Actinomadura latina]
MTDIGSVKAITVCSSSKFYSTARVVAKDLAERGYKIYTPRFEYSEEVVAVSAEEKMMLTKEFLNKIHCSDAIYVIDEGGYTGRSVCIEVGYAFGSKRGIILSEPATEDAITALADAVVPVDQIGQWLAQISRD